MLLLKLPPFRVKLEKDVEDLFVRFKDILGFPDSKLSKRRGFPDAVLFCDNGRELKIEFELKASGFWKHYVYAETTLGRNVGSHWIKDEIGWYVGDDQGNELPWRYPMNNWAIDFKRVWTDDYNIRLMDPDSKLFVGWGGSTGFVEKESGGDLILRSLGDVIDLIVCWIYDRDWNTIMNDKLRVLELESRLSPESLEEMQVEFCVFCGTHQTTTKRNSVPICNVCLKKVRQYTTYLCNKK